MNGLCKAVTSRQLTRKDYLQLVKDRYPIVLEKMEKEYVEIFDEIQKLKRKNAQIILMTQYYPSKTQRNPYIPIYPLMQDLGEALKTDETPHNRTDVDVIHDIMKETYHAILQKIPTEDVIVADLTSSLNPYDNDNHVWQIEPSKVGGRKIAQMLKHIITSEKSSGFVNSFLPEFFEDVINKDSVETPIEKWTPKNPIEFIKERNSIASLLNQIEVQKNKYPVNGLMYKACANVYAEGKALQHKIKNRKNIDSLEESLKSALEVIKYSSNMEAIHHLKDTAVNETTYIWQKFSGALLQLVGATIGSLGKSTHWESAKQKGNLLYVHGVTLFDCHKQTALSKSLTGLAEATVKPALFR